MKSFRVNWKVRALAIACGLIAVGVIVSPRPTARNKVVPTDLYVSVRAKAMRLSKTELALPGLKSVTPLVEGEDVIAGRQAWVMRLNPNRKPSPWVQLWVDKRSHSILAYRQWNSEDELVRSSKVD